jgi:hypothetical protein
MAQTMSKVRESRPRERSEAKQAQREARRQQKRLAAPYRFRPGGARTRDRGRRPPPHPERESGRPRPG